MAVETKYRNPNWRYGLGQLGNGGGGRVIKSPFIIH